MKIDVYDKSQSLGKKHGEILGIIGESVYFDAYSITKIISDFLNKTRNEGFHSYVREKEYSSCMVAYGVSTNSYNWNFESCDFLRWYDNYPIHLIAFEHMISELGAFLFDNEELWIVNRKKAEKAERHECIFDAENKYPEVKDFIEYLFALQVQNNGVRLNYEEMQKALNDFLELEKDKPRQKIKEKDNK